MTANANRPRAVWIVAAFAKGGDELHSNRFDYIASEAARRGCAVTQFISSFDHWKKARRRAPAPADRKVVRVYEPGYRSNVSARRIASHLVFSAALGAHLVAMTVARGRPDVIYCCVPHNLSAFLCGVYCKVLRVEFVVDVHDTWPESLLSIYRVPAWQRPMYHAWRWLADASFRMANRVFAECRRYAARAAEARGQIRAGETVPAIYLGGDVAYFDALDRAPALPEHVRGAFPRFVYAGSLGVNYDLDTIVEAFACVQAVRPGAALVFLGSGERQANLERALADRSLRAWVSGHLPYAELARRLMQCDVGLNAFRPGGNVGYSYKLNDYLLAGLPVINSLEGEAQELVTKHELGLNYRAGDAGSLADAMLAFCDSAAGMAPRRARVRAFARRSLDRKTIYAPIFEAILAAGRGAAEEHDARH